jgi:hypothetical protein
MPAESVKNNDLAAALRLKMSEPHFTGRPGNLHPRFEI